MTPQHCKRCELAYYCCAEHQKACWPQHKLVCKEAATVMDAHALVSLVYKTVELVDTRMNGLVYVETRAEKRKDCETSGSDVTLVLEKKGGGDDDATHSYTAFHDAAVAHAPVDLARQLEEVTGGEERLALHRAKTAALDVPCRMAYWALRCMSGAFTLNACLYDVLQSARAQGYKRLVFSQGVQLSLVQEPRLELVHVRSRHRVHVQVGAETQQAKDVLHHVMVVLDQYAIDLSAGQFWVFDDSQYNRPMAAMPQPIYAMVLGELVDPGTVDTAKVLEKMRGTATHLKRVTDMVLLSLGLYEEEKVEEVVGQ